LRETKAGQCVRCLRVEPQQHRRQAAGNRRARDPVVAAQRDTDQQADREPGDDDPQQRLAVEPRQLQQRQRVVDQRAAPEQPLRVEFP
jgi:hypothetical protein